MFATISCPACAHKFSIPEGAMDKRQTCPSCHSLCLAGESVAAAEAPLKPAAAAPVNKTMLGEIEPPIKYNCPRCKKRLEAPAIEVGAKKPCPACGQRVQVPGAGKADMSHAVTAAPGPQGAAAAAPQAVRSRPPTQAEGETPAAARPAAKLSKNWMMVAGAGGAVLLLGVIGVIGLCAGVLFLLNRQPEKKGNEELVKGEEELSKPIGGLVARKDDEQQPKLTSTLRARSMPKLGTWSVSGVDDQGSKWEATLVFTNNIDEGKNAGYFDWNSGGSSGREHFYGTYEPKTSIIRWTGYRIEKRIGNIVHANYEAQVSADKLHLIDGKWSGPGGVVPGIWTADWKATLGN